MTREEFDALPKVVCVDPKSIPVEMTLTFSDKAAYFAAAVILIVLIGLSASLFKRARVEKSK